MAPPLLTALFGACLIVGIMGERASMDEEIYFETPKHVKNILRSD